MTTVLIATSHLSVGGAEEVIKKQCFFLRESGYDVQIFCSSNFGRTAEYLVKNSFSIHRNMSDLDADITIIHNVHDFPPRRNMILQIHGDPDYPFTRKLLNIYQNVIHTAIASHPKTLQICRNQIGLRTEMILNPIDKSFFSINSGSNENIIGYSGRISPEKNLLSFASILADVKKSLPDLRAIIIGDADPTYKKCTDYKKIVEEKFTSLDVPLTITGFVDNCAEWMSKIKVGVITSQTEGFCNFLWEAHASGVPCVTTDVGSAYMLTQPSKLEDMPNQIINLLSKSIDPVLYKKTAQVAHEDFYKKQFLALINSIKT